MRTEGAYPWDEEFHHTERQFRRSWCGMPLRSEWNASPFRRFCKTCLHCGYKWDAFDFRYRANTRVNGQPAPLLDHEVCWNCHQVETRPEDMRRLWDQLDRPATGTKRIAELKQLGGDR